MLGRDDPLDPIPARHSRDVRPQRPRLRGGHESLAQICRHSRLRFLSRWRDLQRDNVTGVCTRSFAHFPAHSQPVASLAVWFERGSKGEAVNSTLHRRHAPRGELALAFVGRVRKLQELTFPVSAGRNSVALKRILEVLEAILGIFVLYSIVLRWLGKTTTYLAIPSGFSTFDLRVSAFKRSASEHGLPAVRQRSLYWGFSP